MKNITIILTFLAVMVAGGATTYVFVKPETCNGQCGTSVVPESVQNMPPAKASALASIVLQDFSGVEHNIVSNKKISMINSWATWCTFCMRELPELATLQEEFEDDLLIVAVNRGEKLKKAKRKIEEKGLIGRLLFLVDPSNVFYKTIGGFTSPETVFTDSSGKILFHKRGPMSLQEMQEVVTNLLTAQ